MLTSAGLIAFRRRGDGVEVFLAHPGGPYWAKKDDGVWSIPKGEIGDAEDPLVAAQREFREETGFDPAGEFIPLGTVLQRQGKQVSAWAFEGDFDASAMQSNTFEMEWPPRSGSMKSFPECDRGEWFTLQAARLKILPGQAPFLDRLAEAIGARGADSSLRSE